MGTMTGGIERPATVVLQNDILPPDLANGMGWQARSGGLQIDNT